MTTYIFSFILAHKFNIFNIQANLYLKKLSKNICSQCVVYIFAQFQYNNKKKGGTNGKYNKRTNKQSIWNDISTI